MNKLSIKTITNRVLVQYILLFIIAIIIWQIFYPGLMSPDSLAQYEQAKAGRFDDWHPPIMSIFLSGLMLLGGDIGLMMLIQCTASLFGLRSLIIRTLRFFSNGALSIEKAQWMATIGTVIFLLPFLTPFMFFSIIYWKDAWLAIIALWVVSFILWLFENFDQIQKKSYFKLLIWLSLSSAILVLIRHNALVVLPVLCLSVGLLAKNKLGKKWLVMGILPFILAITLNPLINFIFDVGRTYTGNTVFASDMAVFLKLYPELDNEFPLSARHKNAPTVLLTDDGGVWNETTEGIPCPYMNKKICDSEMPLACFGNKENTINITGNDCYMPVGNDNKLLKEEYYKAIKTHPIQLLHAKIYLFGQMLHPRYWEPIAVSCEISGNPMGLKLSDNFVSVREKLCKLNHETAHKKYFNWISGIHPFWLIINVIFLLYFSIKFIFRRESSILLTILIFLLPLFYYLSYILAATTPDYRFMYPSTLLMQVFTLAFIISRFPQIYQKYRSFDLAQLVGEESGAHKTTRTSEEKLQIIIEGLKGKSEKELKNLYNLKDGEYENWRALFLSEAARIFESESQTSRADLINENENLKKKIVDLEAQIEKSN